jgi:hypothetical protein
LTVLEFRVEHWTFRKLRLENEFFFPLIHDPETFMNLVSKDKGLVIGSYPVDLISLSFCVKFSSILVFRQPQMVVIFFIYQRTVNSKKLVAT